MTKAFAVGGVLLLFVAPAFAGPNPSVSLAMHVIVSDDYLECGLVPETMDCEDIVNSATPEEIDVLSFGYVYVCLLAYDFDAVTGLEFALTGWPTPGGRPAIDYCGTYPTVFGDPWATGAAVGGLAEDEGGIMPLAEGGVYCFGWMVFNANSVAGYWPLEIGYAPSSYTTNPSEGNKVTGPGAEYLLDLVDGDHGCTIGGTHPETVVYADCNAPVAVDRLSWSGLKALYR